MISNLFTDVIAVIVVLGVMIFVHEFGHFAAAKWFGVRVLTFSFGFGKRLFGFKRGDTDYRVSLLPFGGYVKMAGDDPSEFQRRSPDELPMGKQVLAGGDSGGVEFLAKPRWQRFVIVLMGPVMNVLLAIGIMTGLYRFHYPMPAYEEQQARVGAVDRGSPAAQAGIQPGDLLLQVDTIHNPKWSDVQMKIVTSVNQPVPVEVQHDGKDIAVTLTPLPEGPSQIGNAGWYPYMPARVSGVESGLPAAKAGLKVGDQILELNGRPVYYWPRLPDELQENGNKALDLTVQRGSRTLTLKVNPIFSEESGKRKWRIGVAFRPDVVVRKLPLGRAISQACGDNLRYMTMTFDVLGKILTQKMSPRSLSGPIGIAQMAGEAYRESFTDLLTLVSFISLQLGVFNLLPIPILDGGLIVLLLIESVMRRDLSLAFKERFVQVGIAFLLLLAVFVMYNDIVKTFRPS